MAVEIMERGNYMQWYNNELLTLAKELGERLLPAFNTTTGMPYPRVSIIQTSFKTTICHGWPYKEGEPQTHNESIQDFIVIVSVFYTSLQTSDKSSIHESMTSRLSHMVEPCNE